MAVGSQRLTEGRVFPTLLRFSLPFLLANVLQALYGAADLFVVGWFADSSAVSAVATGSQVMQTITSLAVALTTGGTVIIGQHFGAGKKQEIADSISTIIVVFALFALLFTGLTTACVTPICRLMQVPAPAFAQTAQYLTICAYGIVFIVGYNAVSGVLRGLGDSKTPLLFVAIACVANIAADFLFVGVFGWGAPGAAVATVFSQALSLLLSLIYLAARGLIGKFRRQRPRARTAHARKILGVGLPVAAQEGLVNASFLVITAIVNRLGVTASAAVGVVEKLIVFTMLPTTAFASAVAAMTAQNLGAGLSRRAYEGLRGGIVLSLAFGVSFFLLAQWDAARFVALFTADGQVIAAGARYLQSYSLDLIVVCFVFCMNTYFSGSGHPVFPLVHSFASTALIRLPLSFWMSNAAEDAMFYIGMAAPAASIVSLLLCKGYLGYLRRGQGAEVGKLTA